jgi:hypothetical protein
MNSKQRILTALNNVQPDKVPIFEALIDEPLSSAWRKSLELTRNNQKLGKAGVLGNIDCRYLLPFGTEEEVEESVKETIEKAAPGGGYIISSSNSIHPGCKAENYMAMIKAAHKYGVYNYDTPLAFPRCSPVERSRHKFAGTCESGLKLLGCVK